MALNMTQKYTKTEVWEVGSNKAPGLAVKSIRNQPGVTITGSGDYVAPATVVGPYSLTAAAGVSGGVGLLPTKATVAVDGAFRFNVTGASNTTAGNTLVYLLTGGTLSLTVATGAIVFGKIDRFIGEKSGTECSVWVGTGTIYQVASA
jgi:hypothetical protein